MPFALFSIGSGLIVLGFSLKVLQITSRLSDTKKGAENKLRNVGWISVAAGVLICLVVLGMPADERNAMIVAGLSIAAVGVSTLMQYYIKPKNERVLGYGSIGVIVVGLILCFIYVLK